MRTGSILTTAAAVLAFSLIKPYKASGQNATAQDTVNYAQQVLRGGSKGTVEHIYLSRALQANKMGDKSADPLMQLVESAQFYTRPIKVVVVPSGHKHVDKTFKKYARAFEKEFNKAIQTKPKTVLNAFTDVALDTAQWLTTWTQFPSKIDNFATGSTPNNIALAAYQKFAKAMMQDHYLASFEFKAAFDSGEKSTDTQIITFTLVPPSSNGAWRFNPDGTSKDKKIKTQRTEP